MPTPSPYIVQPQQFRRLLAAYLDLQGVPKHLRDRAFEKVFPVGASIAQSQLIMRGLAATLDDLDHYARDVANHVPAIDGEQVFFSSHVDALAAKLEAEGRWTEAARDRERIGMAVEQELDEVEQGMRDIKSRKEIYAARN